MTTIMNEHDNLSKLSDYEKLRLNNIHRNNRRLSELGLDKGFSSSLPQRSKKKRYLRQGIVGLKTRRDSIRQEDPGESASQCRT